MRTVGVSIVLLVGTMVALACGPAGAAKRPVQLRTIVLRGIGQAGAFSIARLNDFTAAGALRAPDGIFQFNSKSSLVMCVSTRQICEQQKAAAISAGWAPVEFTRVIVTIAQDGDHATITLADGRSCQAFIAKGSPHGSFSCK